MSSRKIDRLSHLKSDSTQIKKGFPSKQEGIEGNIELRHIPGYGLALFAFSSGNWYVSRMELQKVKKTTKKLVVDTLEVKKGLDLNKTFVKNLDPDKIDGAKKWNDTHKNMINGQFNPKFKDVSTEKVKIVKDVNDGNPSMQMGSSDTECFKIIANYDSGGKGIDKVQYVTLTDSSDADKGKHEFYVDGTGGGNLKLTIDDDGLVAYNPITASEIQTSVGTITLDAASDVVLDANSGIHKFLLAGDADDLCTLTVAANGATTIATADSDGTSGDLTLDIDGDIELNADGGNISLNDNLAPLANFSEGRINIFHDATSYCRIDVTDAGVTQISTHDGTATDADFTINAGGDITLDSGTGKFIAKNNGTEFNVANSAYAGMILGYRMEGEAAVHHSLTLTTSFAVTDANHTVRFIAPPSGVVEVEVQIYANTSTSSKSTYLGLSDNATYNSLGSTYEVQIRKPDETDDGVFTNKWVITGLTPGDTYNYWLGARTSGTVAYLNWGGTGSNRFPDFIMKVTALPTAVSDFAVYG